MTMHLDAADFAKLDDSQRLAILETMVVGLIADNQITAPEVRRFDEIVLGLPWGVDREVLVGMIRGAKERLSALQTPQAINDYVIGLATRLPDPALRDKVVFTMATLMLADGTIDRFEKNTLGLFVVAFGITSERAAAIRAALHLPPMPSEPSTVN
jgi:hypothetical protein